MYLFLTAYLLLAIPSAAAVLRQKQTPVVAIAWLLAIVLLPIGGSLFYLLAGYRKPVRDVPPTDSRPAAGIERMLWYGCSTRVRYRNRVEQLHDGGEAFAALISALQGARRYIHLSYYIFADDRIGHAIADILVRKARAGVEVRLLYDAIGSWKLSERFVCSKQCKCNPTPYITYQKYDQWEKCHCPHIFLLSVHLFFLSILFLYYFAARCLSSASFSCVSACSTVARGHATLNLSNCAVSGPKIIPESSHNFASSSIRCSSSSLLNPYPEKSTHTR